MIKTIGVVGCGTMGAGIACVALQSDYDVIVRETEEGLLKKGLARIYATFDRLEEKGKLTSAREENAS